MVVKGVIEIPYIEGTPARVNHKTGHIFVSKAHFDKLEPVYREFVLAHEEGHLVLSTSNEEAADQYAVNKLLKKGYPLSKIMQSLTRVLNYDKPGHYGRTLNVFSLLAHHDIVNNKNEKLLNLLNEKSMNTPIENMYLDEIYSSSFAENDFDDFLGLGKKASERREERHKMRMEKKEAKNEIRRARAEEKRAKAQAIAEGTYQPESFGSGVAKALGGIGNAAATILGKGGSQEDGEPIVKSAKAEQKNNYTWIFILIGVILLIIVAYFIFFRKKKK